MPGIQRFYADFIRSSILGIGVPENQKRFIQRTERVKTHRRYRLPGTHGNRTETDKTIGRMKAA